MTSLLSRIIAAWPQIARRTMANWQLMSTVIVGVLLATSIMSGAIIYFDALRELALKNSLAQLSVNETNIALKSDRGPTTYAERDKVVRETERQINARVAWALRDRATGVKTATFFLSEVGGEADVGADGPRTFFGNLPDLLDYAAIEPGGRPPGDLPADISGDIPTIEALVPADAAADMGARVGDRFAAVPYWSDSAPYIHVAITGIFTPNDPNDEYWHLNDRIFKAATADSFHTLPFYITEKAYYETLGDTFNQMDSVYGWLLMVDTGKLNANNSRFAYANIEAMDDRLSANLFSYRQITELDEALYDYDLRLFFSKLPMFVILVLISVVILYYVITLSSLVVEQQRGEIALLRSRGASSAQVLSVYALEGLTIAVLATVAAPFLAAAVISLLGFTPAFSDLSGGDRLNILISPNAFLMSAFGGLLSFAALMIPAFQASGMGVTTFRQQSARPYTQPFYQRYYLDVLLLIIGVILLRQLTEQGSVVAVGIFGELAVDQILLAVPAVILVASALALLRLFPLFMRISSALLSSFLSAGLVLGIWQMARNPTHYARLSLMLILMAGLGIFAASFGGTLQRNFEERALYSTGADVRARGMLPGNEGPTLPIRASYQELPSVENVTLAFRGFGTDLSKLFADSYTMFAVEGDRIKDTGWFRDDFSDTPMEDMLTSLAVENLPQGIPIPEDADYIGLTLKPDRPHPGVSVAARLRDANGRYFTYNLGSLDTSRWRFYEALISRENVALFRSRVRPTLPMEFVSLTVYEGDGRNRLRSGAMLVGDIYARMPNGSVQVIESFDSLDGWSLLRAVPEAQSDALKPAQTPDGAQAANFIWAEGRPLISRGIHPGAERQPLPAIATKRFMRVNGHGVGDTIEVSVQGHRIYVNFIGEMDYFPTLETFTDSYIVADLDAVVAYTNLEATGGEIRPNEVWITTNGVPEERAELIAMLEDGRPFAAREIFDRERALADSQVDPLVEAGWRALLFVAFAAVLILSGLGFMVHAYVSFKSREIQFALMRTVGFSMRQLTTLVLLEQALVIGAGLALGTWMGGRLGASMMPFLGHDDRGARILPPFVVDVNWQTLTITYLAMGLLFAVIIAGVILLVRRISLQRILRLGEV